MSQPQIKGTQLDPASLTTAVDASLSSIFDGDVLISGPVLGETLLFIGSPIGWRNSVGVGGITAGDGLSSAGGSPIGSPITQVLSVDSTVARLNATLNDFTFAGDVSLNLTDSTQGGDGNTWRISNTGGQLIVSTRTDIDGAGNNAIVIARTGTTVDSITLPSPLIITASGEGTSSAIQLNSADPTIVFNDTDATATETIWDIGTSQGSPPGLEFRTKTDAHGTGATWLRVRRSGTTVTSIDFVGTAMTFNGGALHAGSPVGAGTGGVSIGSPTPVDNQIAVWKNGTTIEGDANLTWDGSLNGSLGQLLLPLGKGSPTAQNVQTTLAFGDGGTGFYGGVSDTINIAGAGARIWQIHSSGIFSSTGNGPGVLGEASTATNPTLVPVAGDTSTGIGGVPGTLNLIVGSVSAMQFDEAGGNITIVASGPIDGVDGTVSAPTYSFNSSTNTGMYSGGAGSDTLLLTAGGIEAIRWTEAGSPQGVLQAVDAAVGLAAAVVVGSPSSAQGEGIITSSHNVYSTVANVADAATLPAVFIVGTKVYVKNNGANSMNIWPASGDDAGAGANTAVALAAGSSATFIATTANATWTKLIDPPAAGDVSKTGSPVDNQIAVWVDGTTIEGGTNLTYTGSVLQATGNIQTSQATGPVLVDAASGVTLAPNRGTLTTGISGGATGLGIAVGGTSAVSYGLHQGATTGVTFVHNADVGLTAAANQGQGQLLCRSSYNRVTTVTTPNDGLTAFLHGAGAYLFVLNEGANNLQLWPYPGKDLGAGVNVSTIIEPGGYREYFAFDSTTWTLIGSSNLLTAGSPTLPVSGDILYHDGTNWVNLARGTAGQVLTLGSPFGVPSWQATAGGSPVTADLSGLTDVVLGSPLTNNLLFHNGTNWVDTAGELTWDGIQLILPFQGSPTSPAQAAIPALAFGDGDTGFYEPFANTIRVTIAGAEQFQFTGDIFMGTAGNAPRIMNEAPSATNPTLLPGHGDAATGIGSAALGTLNIIANSINCMSFDEAGGVVTNLSLGTFTLNGTSRPGLRNAAASATVPTVHANAGDIDTGLGSSGADAISIIAGAVEAVRYTEAGSPQGGVLQAVEANVGLSAAGSPQVQGNNVITSSWNVYDTVVTDDAVTLPATFVVGTQIWIKNNSANTMEVWPASGDELGGGGPDTALAIATGETALFLATVEDTTWVQLLPLVL